MGKDGKKLNDKFVSINHLCQYISFFDFVCSKNFKDFYF